MKRIGLNKLVKISGGNTQSVKCGSVGLIWIGANLIGGVFQSYWNTMSGICWDN